MRRLPSAILILLLAVSFASCKRDYTCICKEDVYVEHQYSNQNTRIEVIKARDIKQASKTCVAKNSEALDEVGSGHKTICDVTK
ncbi:hypothetical protein [Polluticoccus soli]|uniref:hypothetical protein n=1 Tax=Polluticoccus soli TaxID=3034150 RepID=UPI0023E103D6|nr:hypothetical protein [Flavipsychrobacter sp. JY13-12]